MSRSRRIDHPADSASSSPVETSALTAVQWLELAVGQIAELEARIDTQKIAPEVKAQEIRRYLRQAYGEFAAPVLPVELMQDVGRMMRDWNLHITHRRYFGLFNPSVVPPAIAADALVAAFNPQLAAWSHAPAANEIERHVLAHFARRLGLPEETHAHFTSGGAEANHTALIAALARHLPEYAESGVRTGSRAMIYASRESHHSFDKVVRAVGLGRRSLALLDVDDTLRLDIDRLRAQIRDDRQAGRLPLVVVATAGTTGAGVIDPLVPLAALCREERLWLHVDAAWGGAACLSPRLRPLLEGVEQADSLTWDAHKFLSVPMGAGMFFCRHPEAIPAAFAAQTPYMPSPTEETFDPYSSSLQWSRRHIGLKVFLALATLGESRYAALIERQVDLGDSLRRQLERAGFLLVNRSPLPVICFSHPAIERGELRTEALVSAVARDNFWISPVKLSRREGTVLRACITSFRTEERDLEALVAALESAVRERPR